MEHVLEKPLYGLMAEFDTPEALVDAAAKAHNAGYRKMDAYSPMPIEELHHAMHLPHSKLPLLVLAGGIAGCIGGFGLMVYIAVITYPLNVGGRPFYSWPSFIPITFETTVLAAALTAVVGMLLLNGLPQPYHPVFNAPRFASASRNRFFLCIEADDPQFDLKDTRRFLESLRPNDIAEVEK